MQGFNYRPDRPNRRGPVPVYRSGLAGNRSVPVDFKFEFKFRSWTGSYRYTGRFSRYTDRLACIPVIWENRYTGRFGRYTGDLKKFSDGYKIDPRCEIKGNFGMSYANININDHTKVIIYNYTYKYNSNKRAYKYGVIHLYTWNKSST